MDEAFTKVFLAIHDYSLKNPRLTANDLNNYFKSTLSKPHDKLIVE